MKKILLATTVLVGTAGFAAAEVTLSGDARMGIVNNGDTTDFSSRARVTFTMSGETDGGLSFGASFRADNAADDYDDIEFGESGVYGANFGAESGGAGSVFISGAFGKLSMGNVAGAAEAAVGDLSGVGYTGLGDYSDTTFITGDGAEQNAQAGNPIVQYAYTAGDLSLYLSLNDGDLSFSEPGLPGQEVSGDAYSVGVAYKMGDYNFGLGYENISSAVAGDANHVVASVGGTFGAVSAKAMYGSADLAGTDFTQYGVSATYTADALAVTAFYTNDQLGTAPDSTALGLGASYDLGGGAAVKGGVVSTDNGTVDNTAYDLGVTFSF